MKHINNALDLIHSAKKFAEPCLDRMTELMKRLGNPQNKLAFVHVAGTNGKGTVTKIISSILKEQGYRVGAYTSPFVYKFNERMSINGEDISDNEVVRLSEKVILVCDEMVCDGFSHPTEFEIVTAMGFLFFEGCDFVVLETGLGGRLDATNIIKNPLCSVITAIGLDHTEVLGDTLDKITEEKCGIIKYGCPVVVYPKTDTEIIKSFCIKKGAEMIKAKLPVIKKADINGTIFDYGDFKNLSLPLIGEHMALNGATALETILVLKNKGITISDEAVYEGIKKVVHRGRLETIKKTPLVAIDGAHNVQAVEALKDTVERNFKGKEIVFIVGMLRDKEYREVIKIIGEIPRLLITVTVSSKRAVLAEDLAKVASLYCNNVVSATDAKEAALIALKEKPNAIFCFGSLYMLDEIKKAFDDTLPDK